MDREIRVIVGPERKTSMASEKKPLITKNFLKSLAKGGTKSIPLVGGLIEEMIFGTLEGEAAAREAAKLAGALASIRDSLKGDDANTRVVLERLKDSAQLGIELNGKLDLLLNSMSDEVAETPADVEDAVNALLGPYTDRLNDVVGNAEAVFARLESLFATVTDTEGQAN